MMHKYLEKKQKAETATATLHTLAVCSSLEATEHIGVGSFYELDHSKLPPQAPEKLKSIRLVMVSNKALFKVSVRFPSIHSLQAFLSGDKEDGNLGLPELDEKYFLDPETAAEALYRRVLPDEISDRSKVWSFWAVVTRRRFENLMRTPNPNPNAVAVVGCEKKKARSFEIDLSGLIQWGRRKRVRYLNTTNAWRTPTPSCSNDDDDVDEEGADELDDVTSEEEVEEEEEEEEEEEDLASANVMVLRNRRSERRKQPIKNEKKKPKCEEKKKKKKSKQIVVQNQSEKRIVRAKSSVARWSARRYKLAEENMLKVLKAKGASAGKPVKRAALRNEARKLIGDTGLLDHLLKHMAGKVAPGGADRFRRRHNADGVMEYWTESADLVEIRKEAGIQDPYWIPPPGWKLGDNPNQDPTCAAMFKELRDDIANLKRKEKEHNQHEKGLAIVNTAPANSSSTSMNLDQAYSSILQLKESYAQLAVRKSKFEEQMQQVSQTLSGMEGEMMVLKSTMDAPAAALMYLSQAAEVRKLPSDEGEAKEDKASKLERLRSGFQIFRPRATFLWPNMSMSQHEIDPSAIPTTPSVTASTKPATQLDLVLSQSLHGPDPGSVSGSLIKPFAERRPVITSSLLCNVSPDFTRLPSMSDKTTSKSQSAKTLQINLNEMPCDAQQNDSTAISRTLTYQRRHQPMQARKEKSADAGKDSISTRGHSKTKQQHEFHQQTRRCSSSSPTNTSSAKVVT